MLFKIKTISLSGAYFLPAKIRGGGYNINIIYWEVKSLQSWWC